MHDGAGQLRQLAAPVKANACINKKVRLMAAADPDSLSGKAAKAREYGITIVGEETGSLGSSRKVKPNRSLEWAYARHKAYLQSISRSSTDRRTAFHL
jgi:hypothetical protein